jgi:hypothetical protein
VVLLMVPTATATKERVVHFNTHVYFILLLHILLCIYNYYYMY